MKHANAVTKDATYELDPKRAQHHHPGPAGIHIPHLPIRKLYLFINTTIYQPIRRLYLFINTTTNQEIVSIYKHNYLPIRRVYLFIIITIDYINLYKKHWCTHQSYGPKKFPREHYCFHKKRCLFFKCLKTMNSLKPRENI